MLCCKKILTSEVDIEDEGGWQVANEVFLVQGIQTLKILKRLHGTEGRSDPELYFFRFTDGQRDDEAPRKGEVKIHRERLDLVENTFFKNRD